MQYFTRGLPLPSGQQKQLYYAVPVASAQEVTAEGIVATQLESSCYQGNATYSTMSEKMHTMMLGVSILTILPILSTNEAKDASVQIIPTATMEGKNRVAAFVRGRETGMAVGKLDEGGGPFTPVTGALQECPRCLARTNK
ncbi:uncharacterized protein LOC144132949 isoform X1 [Amblyomma americanum]